MCSGSEAGSYLRLIDFVHHSTLGLRVIKKKVCEGLGAAVFVCTAPGFRVQGSGFRVIYGLRFRVCGLGVGVQGSGFLGLMVWGSGLRFMVCRFWRGVCNSLSSGFRFRVLGAGFRV